MKSEVCKKILSLVLSAVLIFALLPGMAGSANAAAYTGCLSQHDSRWGSYNVNGGTISATGCGVVSLVNAIGYLSGEQMDVIQTALWARRVGGFNPNGAEGTYRTVLYHKVEAEYGAKYGIKVDCDTSGEGYWEGAYSTRLKNHLRKGGVAVGHVYNHFICIVGYDAATNKFHIYDCSASPKRGTNYNNGDVWFTEAAFSQGYMDLDWFCLLSSTRSQETWIERAAFDVMVYRDRNPDLAGMTDSQLKDHWKSNGIKEGRPSSTILDLGFYLNNNSDLKAAFGGDYQKAYNHFITSGYKEYRKSSAVFDGQYYVDHYPDVAANCKDQYMKHYVDHGMAEGRRASLTYDPEYYWFIRPDVAQTWPGDYAMAAKHYAGHGVKAGIEAYDRSAPVISNVSITNVTAAGYTVSCTVSDNWGISKVAFPSWTEANGQDDLASDFMNTQTGTQSGNTYTFTVKASQHGNATGVYVTHIYAVDKGGNQTKAEIKTAVEDGPKTITLIRTASYEIDAAVLHNVSEKTTVRTLLSQLESGDLRVVSAAGKALGNSEAVGTGAKINLYSNGKVTDTLTVVVMGDVDGTGAVDSTDYMRIKAAMLKTSSLDSLQTQAADVDENGTIDATDYMRIKAHFIGSYQLGK
jgi:hypothetical protein